METRGARKKKRRKREERGGVKWTQSDFLNKEEVGRIGKKEKESERCRIPSLSLTGQAEEHPMLRHQIQLAALGLACDCGTLAQTFGWTYDDAHA